jgi:hypothetical protein
MKRFVQGGSRTQSFLLPEALDDYVTPDKQVSLTDPDARSMKTWGTGVVGYNVQVAVDAKHHLIVAHQVTNDGIDRDQLTAMAKRARVERGVDKLTAVADRGYYKSEEIRT